MKAPTSTLDAIDLRILEALQRDGRQTIVALSKEVGLSATPCLRRVQRLEADGVIERYAAIVNPAKVGKGLQAFVQVRLESHAEDAVAAFQRALMARSEVVACHAMSGDMDFMVHVVARDLEAYSDFALKALLCMPGVKDTKSSFVLTTLKSRTFVPVG